MGAEQAGDSESSEDFKGPGGVGEAGGGLGRRAGRERQGDFMHPTPHHSPPRVPGRRGPSPTWRCTQLPAWKRLVLRGHRRQHSPCPQPWKPEGSGWRTRSAPPSRPPETPTGFPSKVGRLEQAVPHRSPFRAAPDQRTQSSSVWESGGLATDPCLSTPGAGPGARAAGAGARPGRGAAPAGSPAGAELAGPGAPPGRGARTAALLAAPGRVTSPAPRPHGPTQLPSPSCVAMESGPSMEGRGGGRTSQFPLPPPLPPRLPHPSHLEVPGDGFLAWGLNSPPGHLWSAAGRGGEGRVL